MRQSVSPAVTLLCAAATVQGFSFPFWTRDILTPLPQNATELELRFQPALDFDTDGCYNTAAIDPDGNTNPGKGATKRPEGDCRDRAQLENSNVYSRTRCNNGYCAIMWVPLWCRPEQGDHRLTNSPRSRYEHYFEKDQAIGGTFIGGHRHDWENIVIFTQGDNVIRVAPSCHGDYDDASNSFPIRDGHPLFVYHKDSIRTHCFRLAGDDDLLQIENPLGVWFLGPLVGWNGWPSLDLRNKLLQTWNGGVGPKLDDEFGDSLSEAAGDHVPGFDPYSDEWTTTGIEVRLSWSHGIHELGCLSSSGP
jgi:hypothetical protein